MKAAYICDGYVDLVREAPCEQIQSWNKEIEKLGLEDYYYLHATFKDLLTVRSDDDEECDD